jgi:hypothetical protein
MNKSIPDILKDLYEIDPHLKTQKTELEYAVSAILAGKPDTHFDSGFAAELRAKLVSTKIKPMPVASPYSSFILSRAFYGIIGSALTILIVVPFTYVATQKATSPNKSIVLNPFSTQVKDLSSGLSPKQQVSNKGINAFGKLALIPTETFSGSSTSSSVIANSTSSALFTLKTASFKKQTIAFEYKGDTISLTDTQGKVFKRTKGIDSGKQLAEMIKQGAFDLTNLSTFDNLNIKNINLAEDKADGYAIGINFEEGEIIVNPNKSYWNDTKAATTTKIDAADLLSFARQFIKVHSIDTSVYGMPIAGDNNQVIYPLIIENKQVFEADGTPFGLVFIIDPHTQKVSRVLNMTSQTYDSSLYNLETDFSQVVGAATTSLSVPQHIKSLSNTKTASTTAILGTPKLVLVRTMTQDKATGATTELFVPAYSFPVTYPDTYVGHGPTSVFIPLVKDFLVKFSSVSTP